MKKTLLILLPMFALTSLPAFAEGAACCSTTAACTMSKAPAAHPLKGVVIDVMTERSALLVKHEAIPGVMKAMTMMLKVDADTLKSASKNQAITGTLTQKDDGWWLEGVVSSSGETN